MRILQGYVSKSIMDFPFHEVYRLDDYNDFRKDVVLFGMYRYEDIRMMQTHDGVKVVFWTGQDAYDLSTFPEELPLCIHVTAHPKVYEVLKKNFRIHKLIKPAAFLNEVKPQTLGKKIYAYCPHTAPEYHGKKLIDELRCGGYEVIIGDGQWTQDQWRNSQADYHYNQCFIGLCLSEFAGGGGSIIEMGLRGMKVVTNVFDLPNCVPWNSIHDIVTAIEQETQSIGHTNPGLAQYVWDDLDHEYKWLEI